MPGLKQKQDRYEMHKYWGKKPSLNLKQLIEKYTKSGDTLLDPFSGYGVFCCEAYILQRNIISNDLNPIANFLNTQLLETDIDISLLKGQWNIIREEFEPFVNEWYSWPILNSEVQLISVLRDKNDRPIRGKVLMNGEKRVREIELSQSEVDQYIAFENTQEITDWYPKEKLFVNSRISAKDGMHVSDLFTKRTLACHARLLGLIEKHSDGKERDLLKMAFTANLANCSKLVPPIKSRGEMFQGAWMTGFYVGPTYIENNVLWYFENRFNKIIKGKIDYLNQLRENYSGIDGLTSPTVHYAVTSNDAKQLKIPDNSIDYIFTDPPYGEAVPYFEQSIIWNAWLNLRPDYENEIVVTDSKERMKTTLRFQEDIHSAFAEIYRVLKPGKFFTFTYHSLSGPEWMAITNAAVLNGFDLHAYEWLVQKSFTPRQINRATSIKGDIMVTLQKSRLASKLDLNHEKLTQARIVAKVDEWLNKEMLTTNEIFLRLMKYIFSNKLVVDELNILSLLRKNYTIDDEQLWSHK